ncbi:hypothetical protein F2Q70_00029984 [Brassica cretica]|uniref:Uncharacterized protein n=2 Tax=Brassica cretica TaxID=69181 RepID=A0A8S9MXM0_BRACR|nr:hypothetical protein F2Q70_00029984 [Brassica cretica]KAF2552463.1 hypothetical protein F2Q68_00034463 [Brassica cretica]KAF3485340.1 hypothetical protein F2Q69_00053256 [Brassica cretica]KAF3591207.1 hypothetical protein DY000_02022276 [Brassica cretica]
MSGNTNDKIAVRNNAGKKTPAATAPMANVYANATVLEKIENLAATFRHKKCNEMSSRFLCPNIKGNDKILSNPVSLAHYRNKEVSTYRHERSCSAKTRPGKRRSPGRINILAIRSGQTDTKREGQMNKQNGEAANPNLRENYGISDLKFLKSDLEVL